MCGRVHAIEYLGDLGQKGTDCPDQSQDTASQEAGYPARHCDRPHTYFFQTWWVDFQTGGLDEFFRKVVDAIEDPHRHFG